MARHRPAGHPPGPPDLAGPRQSQFADLRFYTFPGGCVSYEFNFADGGSPLLATQASGAVDFMPRATLANHVRNTEGLALCGRGAACPG